MNLDVSLAITHHLAWKSKLRSFLDGKQTLTQQEALSCRECKLGHWLYGEGQERYSALAETRLLERAHAEMHDQVRQVIEFRLAGDRRGAEAALEKCDALSDRVVELLGKLKLAAMAA